MKIRIHTVCSFLLVLLFCWTLPVPVRAAENETFSVNAASAILIDVDYNEILYEQNADERRYPASITKVMTGLLTVEAITNGTLSMSTPVTLRDDLYTGIGEGGSTQNLKTGEILTVRDLLNCVLLPSANEACNALADAVAGSIPAFVDQMNQKAAQLGMTNTHFVNTHGYHDDNHYTTARDISRMCAEAMKYPDFREIVSSASYTVPATNLYEKTRVLHDTNALISNVKGLGFLYQHAIGIKTGHTPESGYCLASAAEKNGRMMIGVLLGGQNYTENGKAVEANYFSESIRLLEHGFNDFSRKVILDPAEPIETIPVRLCTVQDYVTVQAAERLEATLPTSLDTAEFERKIEVPKELEAPIEKGQKLGTITVSHDGKTYGTIDLVATTALERSQFLYVLDRIEKFLSQWWVKALLVVIGILALVLFVRVLLFGGIGRSRYRSNRKSAKARSNYRGRKKR